MSKSSYASDRLEHAKSVLTHYFEELAEGNGQHVDTDEIADAVKAIFDAAVVQAKFDLHEELGGRERVAKMDVAGKTS